MVQVQYMRANLPFHQSRLEVAETTRDWRTGRLSVWLTHTRKKAKFTIVSACTDFSKTWLMESLWRWKA
jgi:hypothetical protein